jgi:ribonuclease HI
MKEEVIIYTDGACSGNPGPGGWGAVLIYKGKEKCISGHEEDTTNNRMEITSAIKALQEIKNNNFKIILHTDSKYLINGIETWIKNWKQNGWRSSDRKEVKNKDLWIELDDIRQKFDITWQWVKGHSNNKYNEIADSLATSAIKRK